MLKEIPNVFKTADGWSRLCETCGATVEYHGKHSREAVLSGRHNKGCRYCNPSCKRKVEAPSTATQKLIDSEISSSLNETGSDYSLPFKLGLNDHQTYCYDIKFKRMVIECPDCYHKRMQTIPFEFNDMTVICHACNKRFLIAKSE